MQTRSQTQQPLQYFAPLYQKVDIDFDDSSRAWKSNKKSLGNGCYKYICIKITKTGKQCKNESMEEIDDLSVHGLWYEILF